MPDPGMRGPADPRVERALHALPLGVLVTDASGEPLFWNRFAAQFRHARHSDALVEAAIHELIDDIVGPAAEPVATPDSTAGRERQIDLFGPPERHLLLQATPTLGDDGELIGCVVVIEDETATRRAQRVRIDFVANVSHELRTPVGAIGVLAETLAGASAEAETETVERLAGRLQQEAHRLGVIVDDLLVLSQLDAHDGGDTERIDLASLARSVVEWSADAAGRAGLILRGPAADAGPVVVVGDEGQLSSVVGNLLDNAIKYTDGQGEISVSVRAVRDRAELVVEDTGVGIPEADLDRIFERFYRVDGARSRDTGGTGLGLSIVRRVVVNHGGAIEVCSVEGQGSSFTVDLPLAPSPAPATPRPPAEAEFEVGPEMEEGAGHG